MVRGSLAGHLGCINNCVFILYRVLLRDTHGHTESMSDSSMISASEPLVVW